MSFIKKLFGTTGDNPSQTSSYTDVPPPPNLAGPLETPEPPAFSQVQSDTFDMPSPDLSSGGPSASQVQDDTIPSPNLEMFSEEEEAVESQLREQTTPFQDEFDQPMRPDPAQQIQGQPTQAKQDTDSPESYMFPKRTSKLAEQEISQKREWIRNHNEPLFAKVNDYKDMIGASDKIKASLKECDEIVKRLNELKIEEDREYEKWKKTLLDIYRKINYIDKTFFEQER